MCIPVRMGSVFDFSMDPNVQFEKCILTFSIKNTVLTKNSIESLSIAYYNEEDNSIEFLDTEYDKKNKKLSAKVSHFSSYLVINRDTYYQKLLETSNATRSKKYKLTLTTGETIELDKNPTLEDAAIDTDGDGISDSEELKEPQKVTIYNPKTKTNEIVTVWTYITNPTKKIPMEMELMMQTTLILIVLIH